MWFGYVSIDGALDVRQDASLWTVTAREQYHILGLVKYAIPDPVPDSEILTFAAPATLAPGLPVFLQSWELNSAVKIAYDRADLTGYPIIVGVTSVTCAAHAVVVSFGSSAGGVPSRYGHTYFVNTTTAGVELIRSPASCLAAVATLPSGPYILPVGNWSL